MQNHLKKNTTDEIYLCKQFEVEKENFQKILKNYVAIQFRINHF